MNRRSALRASIAAALAIGVGARPSVAAAAQAAASEGDRAFDDLVREPMSLVALDVIGTANFADAMGGIAVQGPSLLGRAIGRLSGSSHTPADGHHGHAFPLANLGVATALNIVRASAFGPEVRHQTIHELEVTLVGVGMLLGLTSVAKGIISSEQTALEMVDRDDVSIRREPEETIVNSIFQLSIVAAATQVPLSSFGNASIGNEEFREVRVAFTEMYGRFLPPLAEGEASPSREEIVAKIHEELSRCDNPVVVRLVHEVCGDPALVTHSDFAAALQAKATWHTHDLMTILMSTACDDAQAALGDPGPLVGLWQTFGIDFLQALPSLIPYTIAIAFERALWAMDRTGIRRPIFTRERWRHLGRFVLETWKNLIVYFATVAPELTSKITGRRRLSATGGDDEGVGVTFSVLEQVLKDIEAIITTFMDPFLSDRMLDARKVRKAVGDLQDARRQWNEKLGQRVAGRLFPPRPGQEHAAEILREEAVADQAATIGEKAGGGAPYDYQKDALPKNLKDVQIRLASIVDEAGINSFASELASIREAFGPQLLREIDEELARQGQKPTVTTALEVVRGNPRIRQLVDIDYWHQRIGPALTDTLFVVMLQGLHLPFLLSTSERMIYAAGWFKSLPLTAREIISVLYNDALGLFADNWADCVAHAKWLTNMYIGELAAQLRPLAEELPEVAVALRSGHFADDQTALIPARFRANAEQAVALFEVLKARHPAEEARLESALQSYLANIEAYHFKAMIMAMTISVVGAGKSLPGDSTHFTFAAGQTDFTLAVTLLDFKRHPLYHVWELIFSGAYAMVIGPLLAQHGVAPIFGKLALGSGAIQSIRGLMQQGFRARYPGMAERFAELEAQLAAP